MYARKRLDISWADLLYGALSCFTRGSLNSLEHVIEDWFSPASEPSEDCGAVACLSIRSGFDLYLKLLNLPKGSEVLVSSPTIPDMCRIIEHHGLVPIPVDINEATLAPQVEALYRGRSEKTRAVLVAHLMGSRADLDLVAEFAANYGLLLWEDCAQAFEGRAYLGHPRADLVMFSFGPIKTSTALAGGVLLIRNPGLRRSWRAEHARYPVQKQRSYLARVAKYSFFHLVTRPAFYGAFVSACHALGSSPDAVIQSTVRGFIGGNFFIKIRSRPSPALLRLMARRLSQFNGRRIQSRAAAATRLIALTQSAERFPGYRAHAHTYWVTTTTSSAPEILVRRLRKAGFDATQSATLQAVPPPANSPERSAPLSEAFLQKLIYLPVYPELPEAQLQKMARILALKELVGAEGLEPSNGGIKIR